MGGSLDLGDAHWSNEDRRNTAGFSELSNRFVKPVLVGHGVLRRRESMFEASAVEVAHALEGLLLRSEPIGASRVVDKVEAAEGVHPGKSFVVRCRCIAHVE